MNISISNENSQALVVLEGRLDTVNSHSFETQLAPLLQQENPDIVIECSKFEYISSSGLRQFLLLQKGVMAKQGKLVIRNMKPEIKEVFDMTGFSSIFTIE